MSRKAFVSVWDALCGDPVEAKIMKGKSEAFRLIAASILEQRGQLTEAKILAKYKINAVELGRLVKGNLSKFTLERLLEIVVYAGYDFDFIYRPLQAEGKAKKDDSPAQG